jgi:ParB-like chromosome segregation protein Spo0J
VDVWAEYARLSEEEGWTQERIGRAKGVDQSLVSKRITLHQMPDTVKRFMNQKLLEERHLIEILALCTESYFSPLTSEVAWLELAELAATGVTKNGKKTVRAMTPCAWGSRDGEEC